MTTVPEAHAVEAEQSKCAEKMLLKDAGSAEHTFRHGGSAVGLITEQITGPRGRIETLTAIPHVRRPGAPVLIFLPGWWANAKDYSEVLKCFASHGFLVRCFSFRGTGTSDGSTFWGRGLQGDVLAVLQHFNDARMVLIPHSGAIDPVRWAMPAMHQLGISQRVEAVIVIAPLARSGAFPALCRYLRPRRDGTNIQRWFFFLGSNVLGLSWFMRHELCVRRVLLSDAALADCVSHQIKNVDSCAYGRYFLALVRTAPGMRYRNDPFSRYGVRHAIVLHSELDPNFSAAQQADTAAAVGGEFFVLERTCHQWFAEPHSFHTTTQKILGWVEEKSIYGAR